jgi:hypothetical protein
VALLVLITTAFFADVLFGHQRFFIRDLTRYYFPTKRVIREVLLGGELPYWNPYYSAGQPMAANPEYEVFYPPQLLILLPSYDLGYRLHVLVHFYIGVLGVYALLRSMELRRISSMFGAVSLGLGGLYMGLGNLLPILFCAAWIPWILLFTRRLLLRPNLWDFGAAGLFLGIQNLVGEPTTMLQTWFLMGSYALYRAWQDSEPGQRVWGRNLLILLLLVVAGIGVGAAQVLPAFDHVGDSARSRPFTFDLVTAWSMPYARPLELLFPNLFGHIYNRGTWFWGGGIYAGMGSPFLFSIYLGLIPALLLLVAPFARPRGGLLVGFIVVVSVLLALGKNTPLYRWLYDADIATSIRYPEKFALMGLFACAILAAMLLDRILEGDLRLLRRLVVAAAIVCLITVSIAVFSQTDAYGSVFRRLWGQEKSPNAGFMIRMSRGDWLVAAGRTGAAGLLMMLGLAAFRREDRLLRSGWAALTLTFLVVDLAPTCRNVLPRVPRVFFTAPPLARTLDPDKRDYRIFHEADWYGTSQTARKFFGTGDAVYWIVRNGLFPMTPAAWGFRTVLERDYDKTHLHPTIDLTDALWKLKRAGAKHWREAAMEMSNARYYTEYRDFDQERKRVRGQYKLAQPVDMIRVPRNPRYYFADSIVTIASPEQFVQKLTKERFRPGVAFVSFPSFAPAPGKVLGKRERANAIELDVETSGRGFLVLTVTPHKYWRAWLNGKPAVLHRANLGYQGVILDAGRHRLTMRYRNPLVLVGMLISGLSAILLALMMLARRKVAPPRAESTPPPSAA